MRIYQCSGRKRGVCDYESEVKWTGPCPVEKGGCGRLYNIVIKGHDNDAGDVKGNASLAAISQVVKRYVQTGFETFDHVIGGGIVPGSSYVISGPAGCGKSTLLLTVISQFAKEGRIGLYASGEQSRDDLGDICGRIGAVNPHVEAMGNQGDVYAICERAEEIKAKLVVIDSLNTAALEDHDSAEGSAAQMKAVANYLTWWTKKKEIALIAIGHVNAQGDLTGPTSVPHLFDCILELDPAVEYDEDNDMIEETKGLIRLTSGKNRNGESGLTAMFRMNATGVIPVKKKSKLSLV